MHGLELEQLAVDGCTTKAPCGGQVAGPSPVDRRKQGLKRSVAVEAGASPWRWYQRRGEYRAVTRHRRGEQPSKS